MRFAKPISWLLLCGLMTLLAPGALAEQARTPGHIRAVKVQGTAYATNLGTQVQVPLTEGMVIGQQYVVTTGADSSAILLFSNGSTVNLGADSTLSIDEFLQDPFDQALVPTELEAEPTSSVTKISLTRGELVGNVKKINRAAGSSFTVNTPVGAAGIRGTTFRIVFRPDATGKAFFTLSTAEGQVLLEAPVSQQQVDVPTGQEVVVTVDVAVDTTTGTVTVTAPPTTMATTEISPASQAAIATAAQQIVEATAAVIISSTQQAEADKAAQEKAAAEKAAAEKAAAEKAAAEKAAAEKEAAEKAAAEKAAAEKAAAEKAAAEKAAADKAAADKAASDKAAADKAAADKAAADKATQQEQQQQEQQQQQQEQPPANNPPPTPLPPPTTPPSNTTPGDGL